MHENISCLQHQGPFQETLMERTFLNFHQGLTRMGPSQGTLMERKMGRCLKYLGGRAEFR